MGPGPASILGVKLEVLLQEAVLLIIKADEALHRLQGADPLVGQEVIGGAQGMAGAAGGAVHLLAIGPQLVAIAQHGVLRQPSLQRHLFPGQLGIGIDDGFGDGDRRRGRGVKRGGEDALALEGVDHPLGAFLLPARHRHLQPVAIPLGNGDLAARQQLAIALAAGARRGAVKKQRLGIKIDQGLGLGAFLGRQGLQIGESLLVARRHIGKLVGDALVAGDAGFPLAHGLFHHRRRLGLLSVEVHRVVGMARPAFARIGLFHARPNPLGHLQAAILEFLGGVNRPQDLVVNVLRRPQLGCVQRQTFLGHVAIRTAGAHARGVLIVGALFVFLENRILHRMAGNTEFDRIRVFKRAMEHVPAHHAAHRANDQKNTQSPAGAGLPYNSPDALNHYSLSCLLGAGQIIS